MYLQTGFIRILSSDFALALDRKDSAHLLYFLRGLALKKAKKKKNN